MPPAYHFGIAIVSHSGFYLSTTFANILGAACCLRSLFSLVAQAKEEDMRSRCAERIRILAWAWPAVLVVTLVANPAAQAGTTGILEAKLRPGGPVPVKGEETTSAIAISKEAAPGTSSQHVPLEQGDPPWLVLDAWVWRCDPTALVAVWSPKALCEDFVALR